jgi:DNA polymerase (family 10)
VSASNAKIAELLRQYAGVLQLEGVDRFKVKAYRRAAESIESLSDEVASRIKNGEVLKGIPGVGAAIGEKIKEIVKTGKLPQLDRSLSKLKPELAELASRPELNSREVLRAYKKLGINTLGALKKRIESGEVLDKLGARTDFVLRQGMDERPRMLLWNAEPVARQTEKYLRSLDGVEQVSRAGSLRRKVETIGDLNFLVAGKSKTRILREFADFGTLESKQCRGKETTVFRFAGGRTISLTLAPSAQWGYQLLKLTGSEAHLAELRNHLGRRGFTAKSLGKAAADETLIYEKLGLGFIEPELREGRGEVEAAATGKLPRLVELGDIRGDLHMHTTASDGVNTLLEMAEAAKDRGYEYIAITDHSQSLKITNGLSEKRLHAHLKAIDKLNAKLDGITILKSAEVDILEDGKLDYSQGMLKELDLTICSIHSRFALDSKAQTKRIMRAMDNRYFNMLGHSTGRLLLKREGYSPDIKRLIRHAKACGCYFEINSSPDRLDLSDEHAKLVKDAGMKIAINTDAHSIRELDFISAGLNQGRRAWLEEADVLNTYPLAKLRKLLVR